jgi:hypothetical protein
MTDTNKIKCKYKSFKVESIFIFKDGDIIIFGNGETFSTLYDGKTFKPKVTLNVTSDSCFFYLAEEEFGLCISYSFGLKKFEKNRTSFTAIQSFPTKQFETGKSLVKLSNGDILFFKFYMGSMAISVYRKNENFDPLSHADDLYQLQDFRIENCEDIIELNEKEFLGYKKMISSESLELKVYNNENYQVKKVNSIKTEVDRKKRLYFTTKIYKNGNKLLCGGCYKIFIIDLDSLELETTIGIPKVVDKLLIRPNGRIYALSYDDSLYKTKRHFFINDLKIDFTINELVESKELNVTDFLEDKTTIISSFDCYNYFNNGLAVVLDRRELIIFENYSTAYDTNINDNKDIIIINKINQES